MNPVFCKRLGLVDKRFKRKDKTISYTIFLSKVSIRALLFFAGIIRNIRVLTHKVK